MWSLSETYETARREAERNADIIRRRADHALNIYMAHMPGVTREEVGQRLKASNRERLDATPDLNTYPELRGMHEVIEAEWRGTRDGAGLTDDQWAATCNGSFYMHRHIYGEVGRENHGCTCIYFPESDCGPLLAVNLDTDREEPYGPPNGRPGTNTSSWAASPAGFGETNCRPRFFRRPWTRSSAATPAARTKPSRFSNAIGSSALPGT